MSRASAKSASRSAKTAASARKKSSKSARKSVKKPSASASRRSSAKPSRPTRAAAASKPASRKAPAVAAKIVETKISASVKAIIAPSIKAIASEAMMIRTISPPVQPSVPDVPVYPHKYRVGEVVYYTSPSFGRAAATGSYTVIKLLPSDGADYQYRIKSSGEAFERVAKESQLDRA